MAVNRSKAVWQNGVELSEAWLRFGPPDLAAAYRALPRFLDSFAKQASISTLTDFFNAIQLGVAARAETQEIEEKLKNYLLDELFNNQLVATGYRQFPSTSPGPVTIDPEAFNEAEPAWNADTIRVHGKVYGRVRITDVAALTDIPIPKSRKGRQGSATTIRAAIDRIMSCNADFCKIERKKACELIRQELNKEPQKGDGLSDQNLSKYIVDKCDTRQIKP